MVAKKKTGTKTKAQKALGSCAKSCKGKKAGAFRSCVKKCVKSK